MKTDRGETAGLNTFELNSNTLSSLSQCISQAISHPFLPKGLEQIGVFFHSMKEKEAFREITPQTIPEAGELYRRGFLLYQERKWHQAEELFGLLSDLFPLEGNYLYARAAAEQQNQKWEKALSTYWRAITLNAQQVEAYYRIAQCALYLEKEEEALFALELFLKETEGKEQYRELYKQAEQLSSILSSSGKVRE